MGAAMVRLVEQVLEVLEALEAMVSNKEGTITKVLESVCRGSGD
jgi:hypothetical protein